MWNIGGVQLWTGEVLVVHVGDLTANVATLALNQHVDVPHSQTGVLGCLLILRLGVEDVVITLERRTGPDVCRLEALVANVVEVANQDFVIHECSDSSRAHEVHAVEI